MAAVTVARFSLSQAKYRSNDNSPALSLYHVRRRTSMEILGPWSPLIFFATRSCGEIFVSDDGESALPPISVLSQYASVAGVTNHVWDLLAR